MNQPYTISSLNIKKQLLCINTKFFKLFYVLYFSLYFDATFNIVWITKILLVIDPFFDFQAHFITMFLIRVLLFDTLCQHNVSWRYFKLYSSGEKLCEQLLNKLLIFVRSVPVSISLIVILEGLGSYHFFFKWIVP